MQQTFGIFVDKLRSYFTSPEAVSESLVKANEQIVEKEKLLSVLQVEKEKIDAEANRVYRLHMDGQLDAVGFGRFYRPLQDRLTQIENELPKLQAEVDLLKINQVSTEQVISEATDLYSHWNGLDREQKHRIIEGITDRIIIGDGEIDISLCYVPSSEDMTKEQRKL